MSERKLIEEVYKLSRPCDLEEGDIVNSAIRIWIGGPYEGRAVCDECAHSVLQDAPAEEWQNLDFLPAVKAHIAERRLKMVESQAGPDEHGDLQPVPEKFTCDDCGARATCPYAFDAYNTGGDCLASK